LPQMPRANKPSRCSSLASFYNLVSIQEYVLMLQ
jgi:hypothetical protein